jgi:hypothetical protein
MVTTATMIDLARRFVLRPDESVEWTKELSDGPAVVLQTPERMLFLRLVDDLWRIALLPWVSALVLVTREDLDHAAPYQRLLVLPEAGEPIDLADPAQVAELGRRLRDGSLDPLAYAEILVECQWPAPGVRRVVADPANLPAGAPQPPGLRPVEMWDDPHGARWLAFCACREDPDTAGSAAEVTLWSVRVPSDGPATWVRRLL